MYESRVEAVAARVRRAAAAFCAGGLDDEAGDGLGAAREVPLLRASSDCDFPVTVTENTDVNAHTDGHKVSLTRGLVRFAVDDAELAFAIAHEMAHNLIHVGSRAFAGPRRRQEYQADHMGLYLVARAGYSAETAISLLARLASRDSRAGRLHPDYPPFSARYDRLPEIAAEIARKEAAGQPLVPGLIATELAERRAD